MPKIFLSYAREDESAARQIAGALAEAGLEPWLDAGEIRTGDQLLATIAEALDHVEYFAIILTRMALTKPWVLTEMRMALTTEIEKGRPKVLVLRLDDCEVPIELRHKVFLDFRGRFGVALSELMDHVNGLASAVPIPKQTVVAEMIKNADAELWQRLAAGGGTHEWKQSEAANVIRALRADELEAAAVIGSKWSGYKAWERDLAAQVRRAIDCSDANARLIVKRLAADGFLDEADDLDYSKQPEKAWCGGTILWILRRAARRSGLFPSLLPPPLPERLSSLLAYERSVEILGMGWYGVRFVEPVLTAMDAREKAIAAVARIAEPGRTWMFRSQDDRAPLRTERYLTPGDLLTGRLVAADEHEIVGFELAVFDDLCILEG